MSYQGRRVLSRLTFRQAYDKDNPRRQHRHCSLRIVPHDSRWTYRFIITVSALVIIHSLPLAFCYEELTLCRGHPFAFAANCILLSSSWACWLVCHCPSLSAPGVLHDPLDVMSLSTQDEISGVCLLPMANSGHSNNRNRRRLHHLLRPTERKSHVLKFACEPGMDDRERCGSPLSARLERPKTSRSRSIYLSTP